MNNQKKKLIIIVAILLIVAIGLVVYFTGNKKDKDDAYEVGVLQLVQHDALDQATKGFQDALTAKLGDKVTFKVQNASGDTANCATISTTFVSDGVDLIMANATPAVVAAMNATDKIPVVGTSVTVYNFLEGAKNVTGTSDLAPLDGQADMILELFPETKVVGMLYCSAEANSIYQVEEVSKYLNAKGIETKIFTFTDSNDVASVTQKAVGEVDVIYIPTDNTAAAYAETIGNVVIPAKKPVIAGEAGICKGCGVATLSISYYDLGTATGEMAYEILVNGADPAAMEIQYAPKFTKMYNAENAAALGVTIPADYIVIE